MLIQIIPIAGFVSWLFITLTGAWIGKTRGRTAEGFVFSLLFGPFGWLHILMRTNLVKEAEETARRAREKITNDLLRSIAAEVFELRKAMQPKQDSQQEAPDTEYMVRVGGQLRGPVSKNTIADLLADGKLTPDDYASSTQSPKKFLQLRELFCLKA